MIPAVVSPAVHSRAWFELVLDSMSEFVLVKGERSKLLWANRAFREYYGLSNEDLREIVDSEHSDPDDTLQYLRDDHHVFTTGEALEVPEPITRHDGQVEHYITVKTPMRDPDDGSIFGSVGTSRPATDDVERGRSESSRQARKASLERLRRLIDALPVNALLLDAKRRVVASTLHFQEQFGFAAPLGADYDALLGTKLPLDDALANAIDRETQTDRLERRTAEPDRYWEISVRPWYLPDERTGGAFIKFHDVTRAREAEEALKASNAAHSEARGELRSVLTSLGVGAIVVDAKGRVLSCNTEVNAVLGRQAFVGPSTEWFGALGFLDAHGEPIPSSANPVVRALAGEAVRDEWLLLRREDLPSDRWISVSASRVAGARRVAAVLTVSDVTQRKQTQNELEEFAYVASHDLQEPLRMVRSFMSLLDQDYGDVLDDVGREYVHYAKDGAERMAVLVRELLEYSRSGSASLAVADVPMKGLVDKVLHDLAPGVAEAGATVVVDSLPVVRGDAASLEQVVRNLLSNALKFRAADRAPRVVVSGRERADAWIISVEDNGIGLDERYKHKVFRMFQRLHGRSSYSGTGIGLAVCKRVVERHGGTISFNSVVGRGSCFWFSLPRRV